MTPDKPLRPPSRSAGYLRAAKRKRFEETFIPEWRRRNPELSRRWDQALMEVTELKALCFAEFEQAERERTADPQQLKL